jgi:hypothetical protein
LLAVRVVEQAAIKKVLQLQTQVKGVGAVLVMDLLQTAVHVIAQKVAQVVAIRKRKMSLKQVAVLTSPTSVLDRR